MTTVPITVVETTAFIARARGVLSEAERHALIDWLARNPAAGDLVEGGGGIRKLRFAVGQRGKSGGVRVIYFYFSTALPVFLLTVFAKKDRADLSRAEISSLAKAVKTIPTTYGDKR